MLTLNDGRKELYQWDTGRTATVDIDCDIVHFSNLKYGESLAAEVKSGKVAIPNKLLMSGEPIYCWAFVKDESGAYTKKEQTLAVTKRAKPGDYVYTETEVITIKTAVEKALEEAKESGDFKGDKGDKGDDGYTPQKGVDYFTPEDIAELNIPSVDQTYSPNSENAQSGKAVAEAVSDKQDSLVSGTNIKTINNQSILGSGNITIEGGSGSSITIDQTFDPDSENAQSGLAVKEAVLPKLDKPEIAPQVGDILKVTSVNEDGTFATEWAEVEAGSSNEWELLADITTEREVSKIFATVAKDFSEAIIVFNTNNPLVIGSVGGGANYLCYANSRMLCYLGNSSETTYFNTTVHLAHIGDYLYIISFKNCEKQMNDLWAGFQNGIHCIQKIPYTKTFSVENSATMAEGTRYPVGTTFKIYGRV